MGTDTIAGIKYSKPQVVLLQETGIGTAEYAARTCYDSFDASENESISHLHKEISENSHNNYEIFEVNNIEHSNLLDELAWTHFHHSILEHANLTYLIKGASRGVLQEHARHRIQAISVKSTRYTMSNIINAFVSSLQDTDGQKWFINKCISFNMLVTETTTYQEIEWKCTYEKLLYQFITEGRETFLKLSVAKSSLDTVEAANISNMAAEKLFTLLENGKKKRNVGDSFKHLVTDNWKVDMVVTFNLRSLKNYLTLRDSGAAYFQIRWLAQEMMRVTPSKYLDLIIKAK